MVMSTEDRELAERVHSTFEIVLQTYTSCLLEPWCNPAHQRMEQVSDWMLALAERKVVVHYNDPFLFKILEKARIATEISQNDWNYYSPLIYDGPKP